jgi:serine/threonine protein kinase
MVLFEMITGRLPFEGENCSEVLYKITSEEVPDPQKINPDISRPLADVVLRALAREIDDRFATAAEFAAALRAALETKKEEEEVTRRVPSPSESPPRRWLLPVAIAIIATVLLLGAGTGVLWYSLSSSAPPASTVDASPFEASVALPDASAEDGTDADMNDGEEATKTVEAAPPELSPADAAIPDVSPEKAPPDAGSSKRDERRRKRGASPREDGGLQQEEPQPRILPPPTTPRILPPPIKRGDGAG